MIKSAIFSEDRQYRYSLSRIWRVPGQHIVFIGLNPSTAIDDLNDQIEKHEPISWQCSDKAVKLRGGE